MKRAGRTSWRANYSHALGNIHTLEAPYFPKSFYPEAGVLKAVIYFANCQYDDATAIVAQFQQKYQPIYNDLSDVLKRFKGDNQEEPFYKFLKEVQNNKADLEEQREADCQECSPLRSPAPA